MIVNYLHRDFAGDWKAKSICFPALIQYPCTDCGTRPSQRFDPAGPNRVKLGGSRAFRAVMKVRAVVARMPCSTCSTFTPPRLPPRFATSPITIATIPVERHEVRQTGVQEEPRFHLLPVDKSKGLLAKY